MEFKTLFDTINSYGEGSFLQYTVTETIFFIILILVLARIINHLGIKTLQRHYKGSNIKFVLRLKSILIYIIAFYGVFSMFLPFQKILTALAASGGIIAVVLGLAAQEATGNFVNGLMIAIFKPFKIGDLIKIDNGALVGTVIDISLRHTIITTYENTKLVIPNSIMDKAVLENISSVGNQKGNFLEIEISYESDLDLAMKIIEEEITRHENFVDIRSAEEIEKHVPCVITRLVAFADSGMKLRTTVYSKNNAEGFAMLSDLRIAIKKRFDLAGITIPYPHRIVSIKEDISKKEK